MNTAASASIKRPTSLHLLAYWLPWLVLLIIMIAITIGVHRKAYAAKAPPVFDAFSYYHKAYNVWQEIRSGHPERIFSTPPTLRPPGSTIVSAPFGIVDPQNDFRGFFFRNIMVPVWMFGVAALLLLAPAVHGVSGCWLAAGVLGSLMALPMFYQMEWSSIAHTYSWGFQDCVVAAFAALALALLLASVPRRSLMLSLTGGLLAALTITIKPVGLLLMPLLYGQWLVEVASRHWPPLSIWRNSDGYMRRYTLITLVTLAVFFLTIIVICFGSSYLSRNNLGAGMHGAKILLKMTSHWTIGDYFQKLQWTMGYFWFPMLLVCVGLAVFFVVRIASKCRLEPDKLPSIYALAGFCASLIWWVALAGPQERYLFPFLLCFFLVTFRPIWSWMQHRVPPMAKCLCGGAFFLSPITLIVLLFLQPSPVQWQRFFRLNLSAGELDYSTSTARTLLKNIPPGAKQVRLYKPEQYWAVGAMESWFKVRRLARSTTTPAIHSACPLNWRQPEMVRRRELIMCDFIVFEALPNSAAVLAQKEALTADAEVRLLTAWLGTLDSGDGVQLLTNGPLRLLMITDRVRLDVAFREWMSNYRFRPEFDAENRNTLKDQLRYSFQKGIRVYDFREDKSLEPRAQATLLPTEKDLRIEALGKDPQLVFPTIHLPPDTHLVLRVILHTEQSSGAEFFWRSPSGGRPTRNGRVREPTGRGWNELYFEIPPTGPEVKLRFDPGWKKGHYLLRSLEARAVPIGTSKEDLSE